MGLCRLSQHLELLVVLLKPSSVHRCFGSGSIILLEEATRATSHSLHRNTECMLADSLINTSVQSMFFF